MYRIEDGSFAGPGISVFETIVTFVVIPTVMFVVISFLSYVAVMPRKKRKNGSSVVTHIE
ncbi:unannotated protein [freshwater metagenome]|jgi:hypothetical protein|uniref:Unannotated protein n=1 Tax=freshwater metagenome TaxID=449393 RepID=A0A6J6K8Q2_9ZZZZ|nr:hypothetical protein [Actinomycetota bacterium]MSZ28623.1 hypothetical protein [Actinomycetota bacterium]